jgi:DNA (cytosine-5)-methyltransferase 1
MGVTLNTNKTNNCNEMKNYSKTSGRIVIEIDPELKQKLYDALANDGGNLKEWFVKKASHYAYEQEENKQHIEVPQLVNSFISNRNQTCIHKHTVVSLFSGCGGLDLGFKGGFEIFGKEYAKNNLEIIWANDLNKTACNTYFKNIGEEIHCGDIWELIDTLPNSADVVIGGFPCQDISINGKRAGANGTRSGLYKAMVESIERLNPKVFVAENVKGLLMKYNESSLKQVLNDFKKLGYNISIELYNAANYGVPQTRERVFIVGTRKDVRQFVPPKATNSAANWMSAKEAIGDLEKEPKNLNNNHVWSLANISGEQGNRCLKSDRPGYTIRAECHGNIQFHYSEPRRISMREAARFQTFPDNFVFDGGLRETERQVGNAVPPVLGWHIAQSVLSCLQEKQPSN